MKPRGKVKFPLNARPWQKQLIREALVDDGVAVERDGWCAPKRTILSMFLFKPGNDAPNWDTEGMAKCG